MSNSAVIRREILDQVRKRGPGKTVCPSEIARKLAPEETGRRALMPEVRSVAAMLSDEGKIAVTQKGTEVDPTSARGPIRLGLPK